MTASTIAVILLGIFVIILIASHFGSVILEKLFGRNDE